MVELVRAGKSPEYLTQEFEPSAQAIRNWVAQAERNEGLRRDGQGWYNLHRRHSAIEYQSPINFERRYQGGVA
jgi:transposase InsO family protein